MSVQGIKGDIIALAILMEGEVARMLRQTGNVSCHLWHMPLSFIPLSPLLLVFTLRLFHLHGVA